MSLPLAAVGAQSPLSDTQSIKVMVVDDSAVVRGLVTRWIGEESGLEVVARHGNGQLAVADIARSNPDVVILDIEMPVMDGLTALPLLLKACPLTRVIMASTLTQRNAEFSLKALSLGAIDYVPKPDSNSGITTSAKFKNDLIAKIKAIGGRVSRPESLRAKGAPIVPSKVNPLAPGVLARKTDSVNTKAAATPAIGASVLRPFSNVKPRVLVIGSSTGGPQALIKLFEQIAPVIGGIPVFVTQHMPPTFTTILARHIGDVAKRPSREAVHGEAVNPGSIYLAPGGQHMSLKAKGTGCILELDDGPDINYCKPSVEPLFGSAVRIYGSATLAVVLTGMGHDGADGALEIANAGGSVIAQDEATSVVYGMPAAAAAKGACSAILALPDIGPKIARLIK